MTLARGQLMSFHKIRTFFAATKNTAAVKFHSLKKLNSSRKVTRWNLVRAESGTTAQMIVIVVPCNIYLLFVSSKLAISVLLIAWP